MIMVSVENSCVLMVNQHFWTVCFAKSRFDWHFWNHEELS